MCDKFAKNWRAEYADCIGSENKFLNFNFIIISFKSSSMPTGIWTRDLFIDKQWFYQGAFKFNLI